jgi:hypothetical protein
MREYTICILQVTINVLAIRRTYYDWGDKYKGQGSTLMQYSRYKTVNIRSLGSFLNLDSRTLCPPLPSDPLSKNKRYNKLLK